MSEIIIDEILKELRNSPMFRLSLSSKELFHSNFLEWLFYVDKDSFKELILKMAGIDHYDWPTNDEKLKVKREYNNFDLCVVEVNDGNTAEEEIMDYKILFILENKVKSIPYKDQLSRYSTEAQNINNAVCKKNKIDPPTINYILLTLATVFPDGPTINAPKTNKWEVEEGQKWTVCPYSTYSTLINECFNNVSGDKDGLVSAIIKDYCSFINNLSRLSVEWQNDYKDYSTNQSTWFNEEHLKQARKERIHDLYQKLKFSYLCTNLYSSIKSDIEKKELEYEVFASNMGGLFKDNGNWEPQKPYICVNYTYLHGEPLLEINIHPKQGDNLYEIYYTIQVQGTAYERGIQVKAPKKEKKKFTEITAEIIWEKLINNKINLIDKWIYIPKNPEETEPKKITWKYCWSDTEDTLLQSYQPRKVKGLLKYYNKYDMSDGAYLYQKRTINNNPSIKDIINHMLSDLEYVLNNT